MARYFGWALTQNPISASKVDIAALVRGRRHTRVGGGARAQGRGAAGGRRGREEEEEEEEDDEEEGGGKGWNRGAAGPARGALKRVAGAAEEGGLRGRGGGRWLRSCLHHWPALLVEPMPLVGP